MVTNARARNFDGVRNGCAPLAGVTLAAGQLYGTTSGNHYHCIGTGTIFRISPDGSRYRLLHTFGQNHDGSVPAAALFLFHRKLYGTTVEGGDYGKGTVFSIDV
jgi:uncharacterized repeat protein (TIGR03803 family)